ncbi:helix-turn-helix domain-containing protein [Aliiglaciecola sp. M165]|uniref:helix-turn-helix domain-containing protein n=1 Tax=Aliiglaciecola sp. M165 TaxID=2593649 RepID=UPI00117FAF26|nr:helix-turn-helix domain-containing protein [Aliiglaciecola sp. M165]TRY30730.1 hypothetical protein FM019_12630 [Aliiglaciecola sp. M165]
MKKTSNSNARSPLNSKDTSAHAQRLQMLALLEKSVSINTLEFREKGFISPAPRILELRQRGYDILSIREDVRTQDGKLHRGIARYILRVRPQNNGKITGLEDAA